MKLAETIIAEALAGGQQTLSEYDSKRILAAYEIPVTEEALVDDLAVGLIRLDERILFRKTVSSQLLQNVIRSVPIAPRTLDTVVGHDLSDVVLCRFSAQCLVKKVSGSFIEELMILGCRKRRGENKTHQSRNQSS